jgi:hypothetical protein
MRRRPIISAKGRPAAVVVPIEEWRRIEAALEDRADAAAVLAHLERLGETSPDSVLAALPSGTHPVKAPREHRGFAQRRLARAAGANPVYLSQIERGERRAGRAPVAKPAKSLRVDPDMLAPR